MITALILIFTIIATFAFGFVIWGGLIWLLCWGLKAIGIYTICGWTVAFSWPLVIVIVVIWTIISSLFNFTTSKN